MSTATLTFAQALTQAETQARSTLAPELHERLSAAGAVAQDGRVFQTTDGSWQVDSTSREGLVYSVNGTCSCDDAHYNKPPQGVCKHRLAMFLSQRVISLMQQPPAPGVHADMQAHGPEIVANGVNPITAALAMAAAVPMASLPEAPASVNVHVTIAGRDVLVTLHDTDEARLLVRLEELLQRYPLPQPAPEASRQGPSQGQGKGWCQKHQTPMKLNHGEDGRSWYSHRVDGRWCKGK